MSDNPAPALFVQLWDDDGAMAAWVPAWPLLVGLEWKVKTVTCAWRTSLGPFYAAVWDSTQAPFALIPLDIPGSIVRYAQLHMDVAIIMDQIYGVPPRMRMLMAGEQLEEGKP